MEHVLHRTSFLLIISQRGNEYGKCTDSYDETTQNLHIDISTFVKVFVVDRSRVVDRVASESIEFDNFIIFCIFMQRVSPISQFFKFIYCAKVHSTSVLLVGCIYVQSI